MYCAQFLPSLRKRNYSSAASPWRSMVASPSCSELQSSCGVVPETHFVNGPPGKNQNVQLPPLQRAQQLASDCQSTPMYIGR
mmetsp:Transcript_13803/g.20121  ORF Transcript_13803/g.20121 Transcript_13803/m.20121 type:complete len:82 (-) Transcript_13803:381-626(-)